MKNDTTRIIFSVFALCFPLFSRLHASSSSHVIRIQPGRPSPRSLIMLRGTRSDTECTVGLTQHSAKALVTACTGRSVHAGSHWRRVEDLSAP